jgi:GNAT superfamily N-acetyltransferase
MAVKLVTYNTDLKPDFERLNQHWLEELFEVEPADKIIFNDPESYILASGGQIFFILDGKEPVGTCAMLRLSVDEYELAKMAVAPAHRRHGYGERLMKAGLNFAKEAGANKITLITDTKLPEAIRLYERYGFQMIPHTPDPRYKRGNVRMELALASGLHFESNNQ